MRTFTNGVTLLDFSVFVGRGHVKNGCNIAFAMNCKNMGSVKLCGELCEQV